MLKFKRILSISLQIRSICTTSTLSATHYQILGVNPASTQAEIKAAYYDLSKMYHPDKNKGEEAAQKFRAITEAYEVLGNVSLKKLYDKGLISGHAASAPPLETDFEKFHRLRNVRHRPPVYKDEKLYDFNTWTSEHYGKQLKKDKLKKSTISSNRTLTDEKYRSTSEYMLIYTGIIIIICIITGYYSNNDIVRKKNDK